MVHEMATIEPSEIPSRTLNWNPMVWLSHVKCRSNDDRFSVSQWESFIFSNVWASPLRLSLDRFSSTHVTLLLMTLRGIICRHVKQSQHLLGITIGLFIDWGCFLVPWDTGLKFINTPVTDKERGGLEIKNYCSHAKTSTSS